MSELTITQEAFTGLVSLCLADDLTNQVLVLTPAEYVQLQRAVIAYPLQNPDNPIAQREAANLKHLTIYNGHCLPNIIRARFEAEQQLIGPTFHFELHQLTRENGQTTARIVGTL